MRFKQSRAESDSTVVTSSAADTPELPAVKRPRWVYAVIAVLVMLSLILIWVTTTAAFGKSGRGKTWDKLYGSHSLLIPVGPDAWRGPYNRGTAAAMRGDYATASRHLLAAFGRVPAASANEKGSKVGSAECQVRMNYSLSLEAEGDEAWKKAEGGDATAEALARQKFTEAARISKPCTSDGEGGQALASPEDVIHQRQANKPPETPPNTPDPAPSPEDPEPSEEPSNPDPSQSPSPEPDPSPSTESEQEKKLRERREQAEQDYQDRQAGKGPGYGRGKNW